MKSNILPHVLLFNPVLNGKVGLIDTTGDLSRISKIIDSKAFVLFNGTSTYDDCFLLQSELKILHKVRTKLTIYNEDSIVVPDLSLPHSDEVLSPLDIKYTILKVDDNFSSTIVLRVWTNNQIIRNMPRSFFDVLSNNQYSYTDGRNTYYGPLIYWIHDQPILKWRYDTLVRPELMNSDNGVRSLFHDACNWLKDHLNKSGTPSLNSIVLNKGAMLVINNHKVITSTIELSEHELEVVQPKKVIRKVVTEYV